MEKSLIDEFEEDLLADGKAPKTLVSYVGDVRYFIEWLENKGVTFDGVLTRMYVTQYKEHLLRKDYSVDTINKKINSLASFNHFLVRRKLTVELAVHPRKDKVKVAAGSEREVEVLSEEEVERILFYLENGKVSTRNKLIFHLLLYTGIRAGELAAIRIKDIDFLTSHLRIRGKGGKLREVPLREELIELIKRYMQTDRAGNKHVESEYLLLSQRAAKIDRDTTNKVLNKIGEDLKIRLFPHKIRHTHCTRLIARGVQITTVSRIVGHSSVNTTMDYYVNVSREEKQRAVELL